MKYPERLFTRRYVQGKPGKRDCHNACKEQEKLLKEVRVKAAQGGRAGQEWEKIAAFLGRVFQPELEDTRDDRR